MRTIFIKISIFMLIISCQAAKPDQPLESKDANGQEKGNSDSSDACLTSNASLLEAESLTMVIDNAKIDEIKEYYADQVINTVRVSAAKKLSSDSKSNEYEITLENVPQDVKVITLRWLPVNISFYKYDIETMPADRKIVIPYTFDFEGAPLLAIVLTKSLTEAFDSEESRWVFVDLDKI